MTREDIKRCIKQFLDSNYASDNHNECAENLLSEYERKIRAEVIDKLIDIAWHSVDLRDFRREAMKLKENK